MFMVPFDHASLHCAIKVQKKKKKSLNGKNDKPRNDQTPNPLEPMERHLRIPDFEGEEIMASM